MSRVDALLARLPSHLEADRPGKLLYAVAEGLAGFARIAAELLQATFGGGGMGQNPPPPHPA